MFKKKKEKRVKGNTTSVLKNNMNCRHCNLQEEETQEDLEVCEGTRDPRVKLDMNKEHTYMVFWRKLSRNLNEITNKESHAENMKSNW